MSSLQSQMRVEHLAHGQWRSGVLADQAEIGLVLGRHRILQPEQPVRLEVPAQTRRFDRCQAMMHVVQQVDVPTQRLTCSLQTVWALTAGTCCVDQRFSVGNAPSAGS